MNRTLQIILILSTIGVSWLAMMVVHELGHVLHASLSGGMVERVVLDPLAFSRTDLSHNPHPAFVAWGGAVWGCLLPLATLGVVRRFKLRGWYVVQFCAGFCLIANGAYLGIGWIINAGDAGDLVRYGVPTWALMLFGLMTLPGGFYLWHGLGPHFGLGSKRTSVERHVAVGTLVVLLALMCVFSVV